LYRTDVYGELGQECGDAYYYYGKALFGCVAQKNSLLQGNNKLVIKLID